MKLDVINIKGTSTGKSIELPESVFGVEPNEHAVYLAVKQYNAAQRQGTHKSKEKGEITASTRKIKKQKGTGTARAGSLKSGVFRGGGRIFGPRPRNYSFKLNKKVKALARASAFSHKASNGNISVIEDFSFDAPKTKDFKAVVANLSLSDKKSLFITTDHNANVYISSRNIQRTKVVSVDEVNTYQILNANSVVISEGAVQKLKELYAK
jgi:large subunit ribosomal protein L4